MQKGSHVFVTVLCYTVIIVADLGKKPRGPGVSLILGKKKKKSQKKENMALGKQNKTTLLSLVQGLELPLV